MADKLAERISEMEQRHLLGDHNYRKYETYYNSRFRPEALGLAVPPELEHLKVVLGWPRLIVEALAERLNIIGFRTAPNDPTNNDLERIWRVNNMREWSGVAHKEAFVHGRCFIVVGPNAQDPRNPIITVESCKYMTVDLDPRTGQITAALRLYGASPENRVPMYAALYLPDATHYYKRDGGRWVRDGQPFKHDLGKVPVFQLTNRMSIEHREGISEIEDVIDLVDMACRTLTNLGAAVETLSYPQNWVLGATEDDFLDDDGEYVGPQVDARMGRLQLLMNDQAKVQQLSAADLNQFVSVINMLAKALAAVTGLPVHYLGVTSEANPSSADAIRSSEARHVKRAEDRINAFTNVWAQALETAARFAGLPVETVEVQWADPSTPTVAQQADAVVKLYAARLIPLDFARRRLGYTPAEIEQMNQMEGNDPLNRLLAQFPEAEATE